MRDVRACVRALRAPPTGNVQARKPNSNPNISALPQFLDLDNSWLDRLDTGFDFSDIFNVAGDAPTSEGEYGKFPPTCGQAGKARTFARVYTSLLLPFHLNEHNHTGTGTHMNNCSTKYTTAKMGTHMSLS